MSEDRKLNYKEIPSAARLVARTLWGISPSYVLLGLLQEGKDRLVPYITIFITAAVTSRLPVLINDSSQIKGILMLVAAGLALELSSRLIDLLTRNKRARLETKIVIGLNDEFYKSYASLPYYLYENKDVIDAFNYAESFIVRFSQFGAEQLSRMAGAVIELIIVIISLIAVAWFLPILIVAFIPLLIVSIVKLNRERRKLYFENQADRRRGWAIDSMFSPRKIKETRLYGVVEYFLSERRKLQTNIRDTELSIEERLEKLSFAQDVQVGLASFVATGVALWKIAFSGAPIGVFVLAQQLTARAGSAVQNFFNDFEYLDRDLYGFAEYSYITETLQEHKGGDLTLDKTINPDIDVVGAVFVYPESEHKAINNVSLSIPFGSSVAIVGENGAGKTTLARLILGLYKLDKGEITINSVDVGRYDSASLLSHFGVLLQDYGLNEDLTIRDVVWIGDINKPKQDKLIWQALDKADLRKTIEDLPHKLDTYLGKWIDEDRGTELSGGQLQRLAIARVLFRDPSILILDEPTSSVDAIAEVRIFNQLKISREGKTTIYISHRFSTVRKAEKIIVLDKGKIVESGTHEKLIKIKGKYYDMFTKQAEGYK